jgi:hypothetical protein
VLDLKVEVEHILGEGTAVAKYARYGVDIVVKMLFRSLFLCEYCDEYEYVPDVMLGTGVVN